MVWRISLEEKKLKKIKLFWKQLYKCIVPQKATRICGPQRYSTFKTLTARGGSGSYYNAVVLSIITTGNIQFAPEY
jgi:hypothetical protein